MRRAFLILFVGAISATATVRADEAADKAKAMLAEQKKQAEANWALLETGEFAHAESEHFLLYGPKTMEKKLKDTGTALETQYKTARDLLKFPEKMEPFKGKVTVYLLADKTQYAAFVRRVDKKRPETGEFASHMSADDKLEIACGPPVNKWDWPYEAQAAAELAALMLERRAGLMTILPEWLTAGFGRATYYSAKPRDALTQADRRLAADLVGKKKRTAKDIWTGPLEAEEAGALGGMLAYFFAYGPGAAEFEKLLEGFKPEENVEKKTFDQAIEKTKWNKDKIEPAWKLFAGPR